MVEHRLAEALRGDEDDVLALGEEVEREDAIDGGAMELLGPVPLEIGQRFEAAEARGPQLPFESPPRAVVEFGLDDVLQELRRTPA